MFETFLAAILICGAAGEIGEGKCTMVQDKLGPVASLYSCHRRLDKLWIRVQEDSSFIVKLQKEIGPFKIGTYQAHRGFCFDPKLGTQAEQLEKRYGL